ncbi:MAG: ABC transporter substrate-binding protein [Lacrimispora sp.]|uniref:ABC transporter substrate-binding protein n=1 Tax=Lacrimispora sp. TaxID=2719234 RepID=UPI0039E377BB
MRSTLITVTLAALLSGCGNNEKTAGVEAAAPAAKTTGETAADEAGGYTFQDDLGRTVTVKGHERVATLMGSFADIWLLAGGNIAASSRDTWTSFDLNLPEGTVNIGNLMGPDMEQLIAVQPDFVIASANLDAQIELEETLTQAGITVAYFDVNNFDDYLHMLDICTQITGETKRYDTYGTAVQKQVDAAIARADGSAPTVLYLRASSDNVKAKGSVGNVGSEILRELGCVNIADSDESRLEDINMEVIVAEDPDYIFVTTQGENTEQAIKVVEDLLLTDPAWNSLTAVKNGKYHVLDKRLYNSKPNAKWGEAYEQLADILYGEE